MKLGTFLLLALSALSPDPTTATPVSCPDVSPPPPAPPQARCVSLRTSQQGLTWVLLW